MVRVAGVRLAKKICSILVSITPLATEVMERCAVFNLRRVYGNFSSSFVVADPCRTQDFHKGKILAGPGCAWIQFLFHACENACLIPWSAG
jgi:hypothetical protein